MMLLFEDAKMDTVCFSSWGGSGVVLGLKFRWFFYHKGCRKKNARLPSAPVSAWTNPAPTKRSLASLHPLRYKVLSKRSEADKTSVAVRCLWENDSSKIKVTNSYHTRKHARREKFNFLVQIYCWQGCSVSFLRHFFWFFLGDICSSSRHLGKLL